MNSNVSNSQVSITIHNSLSRDFCHLVLYEFDEPFLKLMEGNFTALRQGKEVALFLNSPEEIEQVRWITQNPLFIKF